MGNINLFETVLLFVGIGVAVMGFWLINTAFKADGRVISWEMIMSIFLWLNLLVLMILAGLMLDKEKEKPRSSAKKLEDF